MTDLTLIPRILTRLFVAVAVTIGLTTCYCATLDFWVHKEALAQAERIDLHHPDRPVTQWTSGVRLDMSTDTALFRVKAQ